MFFIVSSIFIVSSFWKKPNLYSLLHSNYRPISKWSFFYKVLEKVISTQLIAFMNNNNIFNSFQSDFSFSYMAPLPHRETAPVKVSTDFSFFCKALCVCYKKSAI